MRTLAGRIVLGALVLMATFGVLTGYAIFEMRALGRHLELLRRTHLEILVQAAKLQSLQAGVVDSLDDAPLSRARLKRNRDLRQKLVDEVLHKLQAVGDVEGADAAAVARMRTQAEFLATEYAATREAYDQLASPTAPPETLMRLKQRENLLARRVQDWFRELRDRTSSTALRLERAERRARLGAIILGAVAAAVALGVTAWSVLTLRPLGRLADGVRRVARGEYRERLEVTGSTEVAEVAREFNAMAQSIEEREQELVRTARLAAVGRMAAVITHEVRNPLSTIALQAELLEEDLGALSDPKQREDARVICRRIHKEVDRLTQITEEYLRFARLPRPRVEKEDLNAIVHDVVEFHREALGTQGVTLVARQGDGVPQVAVDENQIRQALLNLVRNAADALNGRAGKVVVETRPGKEGAEVLVIDDGPGIAADLAPKIFEPFFSTKAHGNGLGLALTHQIVVEHGGTIALEDTPGGGTTFRVTLPAFG